jgi:hypothetical protein
MRRILASAMLALILAGGIMTFAGNAFAGGKSPPHNNGPKCNEGPMEDASCL